MEKSLAEQKEDWESLLVHPAWKVLERHILDQTAGRINGLVLSPLQSADAVYEQEFTKGEIAALRLIAATPGLEIEQLTADIKKLNTGETES
jgi:hypothetical protein